MAKSLKNGIAWVSISIIARNIVSIIQLSILTRFLDKSDFGIIAIATLFVNFTLLFMDMGVSAGIIHIRQINKREYSSLYFLNLILGAFLTIVLYAITPILTAQYNSEDLTIIVRLLCITIFINSLGNQQRVICQKESNFTRLSLVEIISSLVTFITATYTAYKGMGAYSLACSTIAGTLVNNIIHLYYGLRRDHGISFHFSIKEVRPFFKIGIYSVGSQILDFFTRELDIIILSSTLGLEFLGIYNVAKRIPIALYSFIVPVFNKVFAPYFADLNREASSLYQGYLQLSKNVAVLSIPLFFLLSANSPSIMNIMFGSDFIEGAPIQSIFSIMIAFNTFMSMCGSLQIAKGRTDIGLQWTILSISLTAIVYYISSSYGLKWFLIGIVVRTLFDIIFIWIIQYRRLIDMSLTDYLSIFVNPLIICSIVSMPLWLYFYTPNLCVLIISPIVFICIYIVLIMHTSSKLTLINLWYNIKKDIHNV